MKVLLITDQHFGARNDNTIFLDYYEDFYRNTVIPYIDRHKITTIINLGDTFDRRKYVNFNTLERAKKMWFNPLDERGITMHTIVGNHDTYFKNTNEINSPELLLSDYEHIIPYAGPEVLQLDHCDIAILPWICPENYAECMEFVKTAPADILMGHLELSGFAMYRGYENDHGMDSNIFSRFDMVFTGHYHHRSDNGHIYYLGNPYELTWSDYNDPRGFHVFDTKTRELEFIRNPNRMFHKVVYDDRQEVEIDAEKFQHLANRHVKVVVREKNNPYNFDLYMEAIYKNNPAQLTIVEDMDLTSYDEDDIIDQAEDTVTILSKYIDGMEVNVDKSRLDTLMRNLYSEALQASDA
jgi:DNA repair exonuclease SbcCD nuclease subunit